MNRVAALFAAVAAAALAFTPGAAAAKAAPRAPAHIDWTRRVVATPEGGFRMGNPNAKIALVEYGSLACPHCRHFEETGYQPLVDGYVRTGKVSYEFRNLLLNGPDISVSLLTRCSGPANFFPMSQVVYATQPQWEQKFAQLSDADKAALDKMTDQQRIVRFAEIGGLAQLGAKFGLSAARAHQCLSDPKALQQLLDMTKVASANGITHTPTFLINGKETDAATWDQLEPLIRQAGGHG